MLLRLRIRAPRALRLRLRPLDPDQVRGVLSEKPPARLWVAAMSTLFYVMSWLPVWVTDAAMSRKFGLKGTTAELLRLKAAALRAEEKGQ